MPESLRLYLDQMLQTRVAQVLRQAGYDVLRASETGQSRADDQEILRIAIDQRRILITLDEHFGDWAVLPLSEHFGVIRVGKNRDRAPIVFYPPPTDCENRPGGDF